MARNTQTSDENAEKKKLNKQNIAKLLGIFKYLLPYRSNFIFGFLCLILSSISLLFFPFLTGKLVSAANGSSDWIVNDIDTIALMLLGILIVQSFFSFFRVYFFALVNEKGMADIRQSLYSKLMTLPITFYDKRRTGELMSRITADISLLQDTFSTTLAELIRQVITLVGALVFIFLSTPSLSLFMLALFPVAVVIAMVFGRSIKKMARKTQDQLASANIIVEETLQSIHTVKTFTGELSEILRYRKSLNEVVKIALKTAHFRGLFISFIILALFGVIVGVMWKGASLIQDGMDVGNLFSFVLFTTFIGGSIVGLGNIYGTIQKAIGASERVLEIMEEDSEIDVSGTISKPIPVKGKIQFTDACFSYPTRKKLPVLKSISFQINPGEKVALVGHSGAGKSTIIQLLLRFYSLDKGNILLDEKNIENYDLRAYRENIGLVPQEVILFGGTIRENIAYGNPLASEEEIISAASKANALDFINSFPDKMETVVGERGIKLSGGQKQRVAIARAILKDPKILLLDEATSSLDAEAEKEVQYALDSLMANRTSIIIAHRLSTIRKVDKIFVISDGHILESGSHEELSSNVDGAYSNLLKLQFQEI